jgi:hypothetical protein
LEWDELDGGSSPKKYATNKLEHFDFTFKSFEFIQKLRQQMLYSAGYGIHMQKGVINKK